MAAGARGIHPRPGTEAAGEIIEARAGENDVIRPSVEVHRSLHRQRVSGGNDRPDLASHILALGVVAAALQIAKAIQLHQAVFVPLEARCVGRPNIVR